MLSPPKQLDEIQPNLVCELLTWMGRAMSNFFWPRPPGALRRSQKVKYHLISIFKSISKIFLPNFVRGLTNERYRTMVSLVKSDTNPSFWPVKRTCNYLRIFWKPSTKLTHIDSDDDVSWAVNIMFIPAVSINQKREHCHLNHCCSD